MRRLTSGALFATVLATGAAARALRAGDRVWFRHTKSGELSEHLNEYAVVDGDAVADTVPTYRGEGKAFL